MLSGRFNRNEIQVDSRLGENTLGWQVRSEMIVFSSVSTAGLVMMVYCPRIETDVEIVPRCALIVPPIGSHVLPSQRAMVKVSLILERERAAASSTKNWIVAGFSRCNCRSSGAKS